MKRSIQRQIRSVRGPLGLALVLQGMGFVRPSCAQSQQLPPAPTPIKQPPQLNPFATRGRWPLSVYTKPATASPIPTSDDQLGNLLHDRKLSLSLLDAIALAVENNYDVELQRYDPQFAATDVLRSKAGGQLRGVTTTVNELPSGQGGPGEPLLTAVGGYSPTLQPPSSAASLATITGTQSDLSILGTTPYSQGTPIPQFDPVLAANFSLSQLQYPQSTSFSTGTNIYSSHSLYGGASYTQAFSTGTTFATTFSAQRLNEASTRVNLNPFVTGLLNVSITQPLLQGFGIRVNRRFIHIARNEQQISREVFEQQLISTISDVTRLYWDFVSLQADLQVKQESLQAVKRLLKDTQNQVELGTQAPVDATSAQAQVAGSTQAVIGAQAAVMQQELLLKEVLTRKGISDQRIAEASLEATTPIALPEVADLQDLKVLVTLAMQQRPDLALAEAQQDSARQMLKGAHNDLLPQLNIVASMQNNGGAGTLNPSAVAVGGSSATPPSALLGGFGDALSQVFARDYANYAVGFQLNVPLRNRIALADVTRDQLQYRQSQVELERLRSQIRLQVGNAWIAALQAQASYLAANDARVLQEQALEVEKAKFDAGVATTYELLQYQTAFAQASSSTVTALGVYAKARTALERATASTLTNNHILVEDALSNLATGKR